MSPKQNYNFPPELREIVKQDSLNIITSGGLEMPFLASIKSKILYFIVV